VAVETRRYRLDKSAGFAPGQVKLYLDLVGVPGCDPSIVAQYTNDTWWQPLLDNWLRLEWTAAEVLNAAMIDLPFCRRICPRPDLEPE
jgi:hypothetical protein